MKNIIIPNDVKKNVRNKVIKKISVCLAWTALVLILIIILGERCFGRFGGSKYGIYAILLLIPFFATKIYELLFDRSFCGTIEKIDICYSTDSNRGFKPTRETLYTKETIFFHIKTQSGKTIRRKVYENPANPHNISKMYKVGDNVVHLYGTKYIQIISDSNDSIICTLCGMSNPAENECCVSCGKSLKIQIN